MITIWKVSYFRTPRYLNEVVIMFQLLNIGTYFCADKEAPDLYLFLP